MAVLLNGVLVLVGFVLGYFFQTPVLVTFTIICLVIGIYMAATFREMETLATMIFVACAIVANLAMWATHYLVTDQPWLQNFFKTYVFR